MFCSVHRARSCSRVAPRWATKAQGAMLFTHSTQHWRRPRPRRRAHLSRSPQVRDFAECRHFFVLLHSHFLNALFFSQRRHPRRLHHCHPPPPPPWAPTPLLVMTTTRRTFLSQNSLPSSPSRAPRRRASAARLCLRLLLARPSRDAPLAKQSRPRARRPRARRRLRRLPPATTRRSSMPLVSSLSRP